MTPSYGTRIATAVAAAALILPGSALAAHRRHHVRSSVAVPQPTVVVPHIYDAGGDGAAYNNLPAGTKVNLANIPQVNTALGTDLLNQLGIKLP